MKSYLKMTIAVILSLAVIFAVTNLVLNNANKGDSGRPYRVEAERIASKIESGEAYDLSEYEYITNVVRQEADTTITDSDSDYLIKEINGTPYRFEYSYNYDNAKAVKLFNICFGVLSALIILILAIIYIRIIRPFQKISGYPAELAKGNLTAPLQASRSRYFGDFLWGLDLLREKLETQKATELALQKQNKTMVLSLSHDVKTPLGVIELYAKALEKDLYKDEQKKLEVAQNITANCEEVRNYVDGIVKASTEDFLNLEVNDGEYYLSELIRKVKDFYDDKLDFLKIDFSIDSFTERIIKGDLDRAIEIFQNIIENAVKYGDGKLISISFSKEEDSQLVYVRNSGCTLSDNELAHIFDSFWRGSNVGSNTGSGLGLYICRTLARKMNGDVFAEICDGDMIVTVVLALA